MEQEKHYDELSTGQVAYEQLIAYLNSREKRHLLQQVAALAEDSARDQAVADAILAGHWTELFGSEDPTEFPARVLRCLKRGLIPLMSYATAQKFHNVCTHTRHKNLPVRIEWLIDPHNGEVLESSRKMIDETTRLASPSFKAYLLAAQEDAKKRELLTRPDQKPLNLALNHEQLKEETPTRDHIDQYALAFDLKAWERFEKDDPRDWNLPDDEIRFYQLLKELPASEHQFLLLDDPHFDGSRIKPTETLLHHVNYRLGFNLFSRLCVDGVPSCMIPSEGMIKAYMQATRPENPVRASYRIGLSPLDGLHDAMKFGGRDKVISTPLLPNKTWDIIDHYPGLPEYAEAEDHDFYHLTLCRNVPALHTKAFLALSDVVYKIRDELPSCTFYAEELADAMIDMEHRSYDPSLNKSEYSKIFPYVNTTYHSNPEFRFWAAIEHTDIKTRLWIADYYPEKLPKNFNEQRKIIADHLSRWLLDNETDLKNQYGITLKTLRDYPPHDPDSLITMIQAETALLQELI